MGICSFLTEDRSGGRKGMRLSELRRYVLQRILRKRSPHDILLLIIFY